MSKSLLLQHANDNGMIPEPCSSQLQVLGAPSAWHVVNALTSDCAGAPGAGDLNCLRKTCSPSLMTRYFESSGCRCTSKLQVAWQ